MFVDKLNKMLIPFEKLYYKYICLKIFVNALKIVDKLMWQKLLDVRLKIFKNAKTKHL